MKNVPKAAENSRESISSLVLSLSEANLAGGRFSHLPKEIMINKAEVSKYHSLVKSTGIHVLES